MTLQHGIGIPTYCIIICLFLFAIWNSTYLISFVENVSEFNYNTEIDMSMSMSISAPPPSGKSNENEHVISNGLAAIYNLWTSDTLYMQTR